MIFRNRGKQAFTFFNRNTGEKIRLVLKALPEMERDEMENYILTEPDASKIFDFKTPDYELPERARIFQSVICEECGEKTAEQMKAADALAKYHGLFAGKEDEAPRRPPEVAQAIDDAIAALSGKKRKSRKEVKPHE